MNSFIAMLGILDGVTEMFQNAAQSILNGMFNVFMKFASFGDILNKSYGILPELVFDATENKYIITPGAISPFLDISASFGGALALIFLFVAIIDIYTQEKMSLETFAKPFFQYLITMVLLVNVEKVIAGFWSFGALFQNRMMDKFDNLEFMSEINFEFPNDVSMGFCFGILLTSLIVFILALILGIVIRICAYIANFSRMIEAGVRGLGMPIAIGMCADSSLRQGAMRYLRKFFAVALQGGIFVAISLIFSATAVTLFTETINNLGESSQKASDSIKESAAAFKDIFDEDTGELKLEGVENVVVSTTSAVLKNAANVFIQTDLGAFVVSLLSMLIPLIGLGLGSIVVLFKSGQICNDIVGA